MSDSKVPAEIAAAVEDYGDAAVNWGDYALLDGFARFGRWCARQAGTLILILFASVGGGDELFASGIIHSEKPCLAFYPGFISVSDRSEYAGFDSSLSGSCVIKGVCVNLRIVVRYAGLEDVALPTSEHDRRNAFWFSSNAFSNPNHTYAAPQVAPDRSDCCYTLTDIDHVSMNRLMAAVEVRRGNVSNDYAWSMSGNKFLSCQVNGISSGFGKTYREYTENNCEHRYDNGRNCGNDRIVLSDGSSCTTQSDLCDPDSSGRTLILLMCAAFVACFAATLAVR